MENTRRTTRREALRLGAGAASLLLLPRILRGGGGDDAVEVSPPETVADYAARLAFHRRLVFAEAVKTGALPASAAEVEVDPKASIGCALHSAYILLNDPKLESKGAEVPGRPGYTEEGAEAARSANRDGTASPGLAIDLLVATVTWRHHLFDPGGTVVAFGAACRKGTRQGIAYSAITRARAGTWPEQPLLVPAPGQREVPPLYIASTPDVLPDGERESSGTAVTAFFPPGTSLRGARMRLEDGRGKEVEARLSSPETPFDMGPGNRREWLSRMLALIPMKALRKKETYRARFSAEVTPAGEDPKPWKWEREWTFRTMEKHWDMRDRYAIEVK